MARAKVFLELDTKDHVVFIFGVASLLGSHHFWGRLYFWGRLFFGAVFIFLGCPHFNLKRIKLIKFI